MNCLDSQYSLKIALIRFELFTTLPTAATNYKVLHVVTDQQKCIRSLMIKAYGQSILAGTIYRSFQTNLGGNSPSNGTVVKLLVFIHCCSQIKMNGCATYFVRKPPVTL